jgi:hypothetical protein
LRCRDAVSIRIPRQQAFDCVHQLDELERFVEDLDVFAAGHGWLVVAGDEHERNVSPDENVSDFVRQHTIQVHIEERRVNRRNLGEMPCLLHSARWTHNGIAKRGNLLSHNHCDKTFVVDDQNPF